MISGLRIDSLFPVAFKDFSGRWGGDGAAGADGYRSLRRFAPSWPDTEWAIEGATGLGAPLTTRLSEDGVNVVDVSAKLAARVRLLSTDHGRKSDDADAVSVGVAAPRRWMWCSPRVSGSVWSRSRT